MTDRQPAFSGVIPPLVTPLSSDGEVDTGSLERLVGHLLDAGVSGLFVLGSSGETVFLTDRQRGQVLDTVIKTNAGQVPVIAGCIETTTNQVVERGRAALELGADAIVATAPFYTRTHPTEIDRHFRAVRSAVDLPLFAYDIPVSVHVKLDPEMILSLAADGVLDGIKDSSGDDIGFRYLVMGTHALPSFSVLTGHEVVVDAMLLLGADGVVPGLGNVDPHGYVRLWDAAQRRNWIAAKQEQDRLARLFDIVRAADSATAGGSTAGVGAFKSSLVELGVIATNAMSLPLRALEADEVACIRKILLEAGLR